MTGEPDGRPRCTLGCLSACSAGLGLALLGLLLFAAPAVRAQDPPARGPAPASGDAGQRADPRAAGVERRGRPGNLVGHGGPVKALAVDGASGRALTGSFDYAVMSWDVSEDAPKRLQRLDDHNGAVNAVAFVPGGALALAAGDDGVVTLWDLEAAKVVHRFEGHTAKVVDLAVTADGRWAASASWDRSARIWDLKKLEAGPVLEGHTGPVNAVVFSSDGSLLYSASADGSIALWRSNDGALLRPLYKHGWGINVLARLPGTDQLVFGALNGSVGVVDGESGELVRELRSHTRPVLALAVIEKPGLIATGGGEGMIQVLRAGDGSLIEEYRNPYGPVWALAFTAGGTALYYGGLDDFAAFWRIAPRELFEPIDSTFPRRFQVRGEAGTQVAAGELQFARKCSVCHTLQEDGGNRAGPTLHRLFGRKVGTIASYPYSPALKQLDFVWTPETIGKLFELGPEEFTPGSKMPLQRMTDAAQREALIAYLKLATEPEMPDAPVEAPPAGSEQPGRREKP